MHVRTDSVSYGEDLRSGQLNKPADSLPPAGILTILHGLESRTRNERLRFTVGLDAGGAGGFRFEAGVCNLAPLPLLRRLQYPAATSVPIGLYPSCSIYYAALRWLQTHLRNPCVIRMLESWASTVLI